MVPGAAKGYCDRDMTQDYRGMLKSKKPEHIPRLTGASEISEFLNGIEIIKVLTKLNMLLKYQHIFFYAQVS